MLYKSPKIIFHGFVHMGDGGDLFERASEKVCVDLEWHVASGLEWVQVRTELTNNHNEIYIQGNKKSADGVG